MAKDKRPNYMRMAREATPIIIDEKNAISKLAQPILKKKAQT